MKVFVVALARSFSLTHGRQDDINNRLFAAADRHLHGDAIGQCQASTNQHVMTSPKHTWEKSQLNHDLTHQACQLTMTIYVCDEENHVL